MILILGGTSDAEKIAEILASAHLEFLVSVATDYGVRVTEKYTDRVIKGRMDASEMVDFIQREKIEMIIDGTHPFANLVSENAIAASQKTNCRYLRYERATIPLADVQTVATSQEACDLAMVTSGSVYLTVGSKTMADYVSLLPLERIKTRVLPVASVIKQLEALGLNSDHIDGIKGPFSKELNKQLLINAGATALITKESGITGGLVEKSQACQELAIPCIVIQRPKVNYPMVVSEMSALSQWLKEVYR